MTWVKKTPLPGPALHRCEPPMQTKKTYGHLGLGIPSVNYTTPAGAFGDLWRCDDCDALWRVGNSCDDCDPAPTFGGCRRGGFHLPGMEWRPASWWQRLIHRPPRTSFTRLTETE